MAMNKSLQPRISRNSDAVILIDSSEVSYRNRLKFDKGLQLKHKSIGLVTRQYQAPRWADEEVLLLHIEVLLLHLLVDK
jgi:hypothetical protein